MYKGFSNYATWRTAAECRSTTASENKWDRRAEEALYDGSRMRTSSEAADILAKEIEQEVLTYRPEMRPGYYDDLLKRAVMSDIKFREVALFLLNQ